MHRGKLKNATVNKQNKIKQKTVPQWLQDATFIVYFLACSNLLQNDNNFDSKTLSAMPTSHT